MLKLEKSVLENVNGGCGCHHRRPHGDLRRHHRRNKRQRHRHHRVL